MNRLANAHEATSAYVPKHTGGNKADLDTLRRLKRYIVREIYPLLREALDHPDDAVPLAA
ncbi:MAG: hypothetical protein M3O70_08125 [Actinomycetota bacterium]|nr:hypothetical protein [Actinomycetota bacterium]